MAKRKSAELAAEASEVPMQRLTFDIPESTHRRLKLLAVETGRPMTKLLLEWIEAQLAKAGKPTK